MEIYLFSFHQGPVKRLIVIPLWQERDGHQKNAEFYSMDSCLSSRGNRRGLCSKELFTGWTFLTILRENFTFIIGQRIINNLFLSLMSANASITGYSIHTCEGDDKSFTSYWVLYLNKASFNSLVWWIITFMSNFTLFSLSLKLVVPDRVCPGMCALIIVVFLSVSPCAHVPIQVCAHMWVY